MATINSQSIVTAAVHARGDQDIKVRGYTRRTSPRPDGAAYLAITIGNVLIYMNDAEAALAWCNAFSKARTMIDGAFGGNGELDQPWEPVPKK